MKGSLWGKGKAAFLVVTFVKSDSKPGDFEQPLHMLLAEQLSLRCVIEADFNMQPY